MMSYFSICTKLYFRVYFEVQMTYIFTYSTAQLKFIIEQWTLLEFLAVREVKLSDKNPSNIWNEPKSSEFYFEDTKPQWSGTKNELFSLSFVRWKRVLLEEKRKKNTFKEESHREQIDRYSEKRAKLPMQLNVYCIGGVRRLKWPRI